MMVCTQCGFQNETEDAFCGSCGAFLEFVGEKVDTDAPVPAAMMVETESSPVETATTISSEPAPEDAAKAVAFPPGPTSPFRGEEPAGPEAEPSTGPVAASLGRRPGAGEEAVVDARADSTSAEPVPTAEPEAKAEGTGEKPVVTGPQLGAGAGPGTRPGPVAPAETAGAVEAKKPEARSRGPAVVTGTQSGPTPQARSQAPPARPPRATPPPGPVARRPDAVKTTGARPRPVPSKPPPKRDLRPGDLVCGQCQEGNDPNRKFCRRCGASLVEAKEAVVVPPPPVPWWKRPFVRPQPQVVAAGERPIRRGGSNASRDLRSRARQVRRVLAPLAIVGLGLGFVGPWRYMVVNLTRRVREAVAPTLEPARPSGVTASSSQPGHPPQSITDGKTGPGKYWAEGVKGDGVGERLIVTFQPPINLRKIGFSTGISQEDPEAFQKEPRPEKIRLHFGEGKTKDLTLEDKGEFQFKDVRAKGVGQLQIEIRSVYRSLQSGSDTSIGEIEFQKER